jgi:hypothetical protein
MSNRADSDIISSIETMPPGAVLHFQGITWDEYEQLLEQMDDRLYAASIRGRVASGPNAGRRVTVGGDRVDPESLGSPAVPRCASVSGFSLHANVAVPARDRGRLERLCKYAGRPPLATDRLEALPDGRLRYAMKTPWRDGTTHVIFEPLELIEKLCALIPRPRAHTVRYHGLLGPAAKWRAMIVPNPPPAPPVVAAAQSTTQMAEASTPATASSGAHAPDPAQSSEGSAVREHQPRNYTWAQLMRRVFKSDVLACSLCGGRLRILATIRPPEITRKILNHLGLPSRPPPPAPAILQELPFAST